MQPISTDYRGWKVSELPPNGQGIGTLEMLNILENFPIGQYEQTSVEALHLEIEAEKLASRDLARYVADPKFAPCPLRASCRSRMPDSARRLIDPEKAHCEVEAGHPAAGRARQHHLSERGGQGRQHRLLDSEQLRDLRLRNPGAGDGIPVARSRGVVRFRSRIIPTRSRRASVPSTPSFPAFLEHGTQHIAFGIMRGVNQPQAQMQFVSNIVDHKMNIQAALEAPRFTKLTAGGCDLLIEARVPEIVRGRVGTAGTSSGGAGRFFRAHGRRASGAA